MIIEFPPSDDANLLEWELTRCSRPGWVRTEWPAPGVLRLIAPQPVMAHIIQGHWAPLALGPARIVTPQESSPEG